MKLCLDQPTVGSSAVRAHVPALVYRLAGLAWRQNTTSQRNTGGLSDRPLLLSCRWRTRTRYRTNTPPRVPHWLRFRLSMDGFGACETVVGFIVRLQIVAGWQFEAGLVQRLSCSVKYHKVKKILYHFIILSRLPFFKYLFIILIHNVACHFFRVFFFKQKRVLLQTPPLPRTLIHNAT